MTAPAMRSPPIIGRRESRITGLPPGLAGRPAYPTGAILSTGSCPLRRALERRPPIIPPERRPVAECPCRRRRSLGEDRDPATPTCRPAIRQRLPVRRHLPHGGQGRRLLPLCTDSCRVTNPSYGPNPRSFPFELDSEGLGLETSNASSITVHTDTE